MSAISPQYPSMFDLLDQIEQITQFKPIEIVYSGRIHRFGNNQCCWYVAYSSGVITCGNWKTGVKQSFYNQVNSHLRQINNNSIELVQNQRKLEILKQEKLTRQRQLWAAAKPENNFHSYLQKKKVNAFGLKLKGQVLLVPIRNINGELQALQHIYPDGTKRIHASYKKGFHCIGKLVPEGKVYIGEGYATMATIHELTGCCSAVAFSTSNLAHVGFVIRKKYPRADIIFCADNDRDTEKRIGSNVGVEYARKAAKLCFAKVLIPKFSGLETGTDFNDLVILRGANHG